MKFFAFISIFLSLYGLLHLYAFVKVQKAFALSQGGSVGLACFLVIMVSSPVIVRVIERVALDALSRAIAFGAFVWMGFLFLFVSAALMIDLYRLIAMVALHVFDGSMGRWMPSARVIFFMALCASVLATAYGYVEALTIRTEHVVIHTPKIPKGLEKLRIVQVSDIHLGWIVGERRLERILSKVQEAKPHILVCTGDLVDGQMDNAAGLAEMFQRIHAPYGKYAVTGNHEFYAGLERSLEFTRAAGFEILRGTATEVGGIIYVAGVDDEAGHRDGLYRGEGEAELLSRVPAGRFAILLKHRPNVGQKRARRFDLQLSGHTHGGQIFPFSLIVKMAYPVEQGLIQGQGGSYVYVNRGAGTWGPPLRFMAPPEITVIDLVHPSGAK